MDAVVMAGGRATRLRPLGEKALQEIGGMTLLDRAVGALDGCGIHFLVAVSPHTPGTRTYCSLKGYPTVETPGTGYPDDLRWLLDRLGAFLSLVSDLPFLRSHHLQEFLRGHGGGSWTGLLPSHLVPPGFGHNHIAQLPSGPHVHVGINVVDEGEDRGHHTFKDPLLGVCINTPEDLARARRLMEKGK